ncbi:hypothetical protein J8Z28_13560 [Pseudoalteromonas sp. SCSIO 43088]|uniref:hypothetical protein n=1 Tax=Pseudoalteromonas sp. SCSIO 43088 TaxID=2822846 RepID=UPI00202B6C2F|nr:hypothetical protein [Pseudoalteromonas sp. SCSIO 43088]URQ85568.1 hypothetical protein J8Z28_13560 [Pseudoalteromonas sp. SCSIO 43088]
MIFPEQLDIFYFEIEERLKDIEKDHEDAVKGGMFFTATDSFPEILTRLKQIQDKINLHFKS